MNDKLLMELSKPFAPGRVTWRAGAVKGDKTKAMALAYADPRAYMERLDDVCGIDWAVSYTPWGERIICHVTIGGMTRSSTGEPDKDSERNELSGTVAEAQAFKRACTMFGLGRYLYDFDSPWVEFDGKNFTAQGKAKLDALVASHYQRSAASHRTVQVSIENRSQLDTTLDGITVADSEPMAFDDEPPTKVRDWLATENPGLAAMNWAVECKAQPNEFAARNSLKKIVDIQGGKLNKGNAGNILTAYYFRQVEHISDARGVAVA